MPKMLSEAQVLKKLNIPDFRHLSKDNVMSFVSMIDKMDPEVAKKALEQFPDFAKVSIESLAPIVFMTCVILLLMLLSLQ